MYMVGKHVTVRMEIAIGGIERRECNYRIYSTQKQSSCIPIPNPFENID